MKMELVRMLRNKNIKVKKAQKETLRAQRSDRDSVKEIQNVVNVKSATDDLK